MRIAIRIKIFLINGEIIMGWIGEYNCQSEIREHVLKQFKESNCPYELLQIKSTAFSRHIWAAAKDKQTGQSLIFFWLLNGSRNHWAYKSMDEDMGPCEVDCPLNLIEMTTGTGTEFGTNWRQKVRDYHANIKANNEGLEPGLIVLVYGKKFKLIEKKKRSSSWIATKLDTGGRFRINRKQIERFESNSAEYITNVLGKEEYV